MICRLVNQNESHATICRSYFQYAAQVALELSSIGPTGFSLHDEPGAAKRVPSVGVFLLDASPDSRELWRKTPTV